MLRKLFVKWKAYFEVCHPFPLVMIALLTYLFSISAAKGFPPFPKITVIIAAICCSQISINSLNDFFDRELDHRFKPNKPISSGRLSPKEVVVLAIVSFFTMCILAIKFGPISLLLGIIGTGAGFLYDVKLKRTILSWLPFMIAYPLLVFWTRMALGEFEWKLLWAYPIIGLLSIGIHITNTLPDLESDISFHLRGLVHILGKNKSVILGAVCYIAAPLLAIFLNPWLDYNYSLLRLTAILSLAFTTAGLLLYSRDMSLNTLQRSFKLLAFSALIFMSGWVASLSL